MFSFLKSTDALATELREWSLEETTRRCDEETRATYRQMIWGDDLKTVAQSVGALCLSRIKNAEMMRQIGGMHIPIFETLRYYNGYKLVESLAKRRGWTVTYHGSMVDGYTCRIS